MMSAEMAGIHVFIAETNFQRLFDVACDLHILSTSIHVISIFLNRMIMQTVLNVFKAFNKMTLILQINQL